MTRNALTVRLLLCAVTFAGGCASAGTPTAPRPAASIGECSGLQAEIARTERAKREALEKQQTAWKAVVPFAVAARHSAGKSAAGEADKRLVELYRESVRRNCSSKA